MNLNADHQGVETPVKPAAERTLHVRGMPIDDLISAFLGSNTVYYRPVFIRMEQEGAKFHANFAAFFFTPIWLAYRGFYLPLIVLYALPVAAIVTRSTWFFLVSAGPLTPLFFLGPFTASILFCSFGNYLLFRRFRRVVIDKSISRENLISRLERRGGGSMIVLVLATATLTILFIGYPVSLIISAIVNPPGSLQ